MLASTQVEPEVPSMVRTSRLPVALMPGLFCGLAAFATVQYAFAQSSTPYGAGVDGTILDQYPNFVPLPVRVLPAKGELPPQHLASAPSPFSSNCDSGQTGISFVNAELEPHVAINPLDGQHLIGAWQQDRWSNGGARGLVASVSFDGGSSWTRVPMPFSRCGGGNASNGGNYLRATDPWVAFSADGTAFVMALAFSGGSFQAGSVNAMLVSRSLDGGLSWSNPTTLIQDGSSFFNDKNTLTADPVDPQFVYATWDRLTTNDDGPTWFARSVNGGATWQAARPIYTPGSMKQTIGNLIVVLPDGMLVNLFTQIDNAPTNPVPPFLAVIRSSDKGATWSAPVKIADWLAIGASDPENGTPIRDGSIIAQIAVAPDGKLYVVWQDARFSGGLRDGIAISRSSDGGSTWSSPIRVNGAAGAQAFMPNVHVSPDGTIGVTYYDLRSNTADPGTLLADYWIARSTQGITWQESRVSPPFDLSIAPVAGGLFLGDYQGLVSRGNVLVPFFARTSAGDLGNRTDVFSAPALFVVSQTVPGTQVSNPLPGFRQRVMLNLIRQKQLRLIRWERRD